MDKKPPAQILRPVGIPSEEAFKVQIPVYPVPDPGSEDDVLVARQQPKVRTIPRITCPRCHAGIRSIEYAKHLKKCGLSAYTQCGICGVKVRASELDAHAEQNH